MIYYGCNEIRKNIRVQQKETGEFRWALKENSQVYRKVCDTNGHCKLKDKMQFNNLQVIINLHKRPGKFSRHRIITI